MEGVRIEEIQGRGRSVISSQSLKAGQIILRDSPLLLYSAHPFSAPPHHHRRNHYCSHCFRTISSHHSPVATCLTCSDASSESSKILFCSPNCQSAAAATSHTPWACNALLRFRHCLSQHPEELQVQARFLIAAYNLAVVFPPNFKILLSLHGEGDSVGENGVLLHSLISSLCPPPQAKIGFCLELTTALLAKDKLNAFGLMEPPLGNTSSVRAYGIYPNASLFNHDCLPNACRFDYVDNAGDVANTDIVIRMIHDVSQGREICLSYFPVNLNYRERQLRLKDDYGFVCSCDRCQVEANWSESDDENDGGVEGEDDVAMDEDDNENDELMEATEDEDGNENGNDFPHAYFFLRYMCTQENCWGTLAPLPTQPSSIGTSNSSSGVIMECNVCGNLKNDEVETGVDASPS